MILPIPRKEEEWQAWASRLIAILSTQGAGTTAVTMPNAQFLAAGSGITISGALVSATAPRTIGLTNDGMGSVVTAGHKGSVTVPFAGTITGWRILADQVGSIVVDVWSAPFGGSPPSIADTITGSEKPTLSSDWANEDASLTTWDTAVVAGDVIAFNVDSASTVRRVTLTLTVTPS